MTLSLLFTSSLEGKNRLFSSRNFLLLILQVIAIYSIHAQDQDHVGQSVVVPPSPEAAQLGTYGEFFVSMTTGSADISIPITSIQESGINIPVTLSYQSNGLRVAQRPSLVGMGWLLSAGGAITRTMRGRCDDLSSGFLQNLSDIPNAQIITNELQSASTRDGAYNKLNLMVVNGVDYVPDAFSFNFTGHGGSFFIGNDDEIHNVDHGSLTFVKHNGSIPNVGNNIIVSWTVTDDNGLVYEFADYETTRVRTADNLIQEYISAWYLSTIYNPITKTTAVFSYDNTNYQFEYNDVSTSITYQKEVDDLNYGNQSGTMTSVQNTINKYVKFPSNITLNDHAIAFYTSSSSSGFRKLDSIQWSNGSASKKFLFGHSYYPSLCTSGPDCKRLKLNSITEFDASNPKVYTFNYNGGSVPGRKSYSQDNWGFFNGASNEDSLIPDIEYGGDVYGGGANRLPNFEKMKIGMLYKIIYPTKGSTSFYYEQNSYEDITNEEEVTAITFDETMDVTGINYKDEQCTVENINLREGGDGAISPDTDYRFVYQCRLVLDDEPDFRNYPILTITDISENPHEEIRSHIIKGIDDYTIEPNELIPGHAYRFELCAYGSSQRAKVDLVLEETRPEDIGNPVARLTGGLRLSSMENFDPFSNITETKTFDYGYGGYLIYGLPSYHNIYTTVTSGGADFGRVEHRTLAINSSPTSGMSLSSIPVAYEKVIEWAGTKSINNGRIETIFHRRTNEGSPLTIQESKHSVRTLIKNKRYYDVNGTLLREEDYNYNHRIMGKAMGFKGLRRISVAAGAAKDYSEDFLFANFTLNSYWNQLISKETRDYSAVGVISNMEIYQYDSDLHTNITKKKVYNSKDDELIIEYTYPIDRTTCENTCYYDYLYALANCPINTSNVYSVCQNNELIDYKNCQDSWKNCLENEQYSADQSQAAVALLNVNNIQSRPIEVVSFNEGEELIRNTGQYGLWYDTPLLESTKISYGTSGYLPILTFNQYDSKGNPLEVLDHKTGLINSYIWGYNKTYLIAHIVNASYSVVSAALGSDLNLLNGNTLSEDQILTKINNLRLHSSMKKAQVTTYTYQQGIGISTIVDQNGIKKIYSYDDMERLKVVKVLNPQSEDAEMYEKYEYNFGN